MIAHIIGTLSGQVPVKTCADLAGSCQKVVSDCQFRTQFWSKLRSRGVNLSSLLTGPGGFLVQSWLAPVLIWDQEYGQLSRRSGQGFSPFLRGPPKTWSGAGLRARPAHSKVVQNLTRNVVKHCAQTYGICVVTPVSLRAHLLVKGGHETCQNVKDHRRRLSL